ncbi:diguanylate cyclase [bacterium]|nr:diguanylate cyclase [bacterium]
MKKPIEISKNIYWVGVYDQESNMQCNPYLIIDGEQGVLIDPGSTISFEETLEKVTSLISLDKIRHVVCCHQDPDVCSSLPLWEKRAEFEIVTHWRTALIIKYYGHHSRYYLVNEHDYKLDFSENRSLHFVHTPYLHFPGAVGVYDPTSRIFFSSDLFGAFSENWDLWAGDNYIETMKSFHENYMPGNEILRPVMEVLLGMDISMIAPQHGSIIRENVRGHIEALRDLECGSFLNPIKKEISKSGGFTGLCNMILKRYYSLYDKLEILSIFEESDIKLDSQTGMIIDFNCTGAELWDRLFDRIVSQKGIGWIATVEMLVEKTVKEYGIDYPTVFKSTIFNVEKLSDQLSQENKRLKEANERLQTNLKETEEKLIRCPLTNLHNETFFQQYFQNEVRDALLNHRNGALLLIELDNVTSLDLHYGKKVLNETLKILSYLLSELKLGQDYVFKMEGPEYAYHIPECTSEDSVVAAERIRTHIAESDLFIEKITVSIGLININEFYGEDPSQNPALKMIDVARLRSSIAKSKGANLVCSQSTISELSHLQCKILIIDSDSSFVNVLKASLETAGFSVLHSFDGETGLGLIEKESPDVIVAEVMLPKADGFIIREKIMASSSLKKKLFILVSHQKNEASIKRAVSLKIEHYFKKPVVLAELVGLIKNRLLSS